MRTLADRVRSVLTPDLLKPEWRNRAAHPMAGHCSAASEALYHMFGGKPAGWVPVVLRLDENTTHWWLRGPNGEIVDATADQFPFPVPYERGKGCGFQTPGGIPSKRAQAIIDRVNAADHAQAA